MHGAPSPPAGSTTPTSLGGAGGDAGVSGSFELQWRSKARALTDLSARFALLTDASQIDVRFVAGGNGSACDPRSANRTLRCQLGSLWSHAGGVGDLTVGQVEADPKADEAAIGLIEFAQARCEASHIIPEGHLALDIEVGVWRGPEASECSPECLLPPKVRQCVILGDVEKPEEHAVAIRADAIVRGEGGGEDVPCDVLGRGVALEPTETVAIDAVVVQDVDLREREDVRWLS